MPAFNPVFILIAITLWHRVTVRSIDLRYFVILLSRPNGDPRRRQF
jgi:hypothetical protein